MLKTYWRFWSKQVAAVTAASLALAAVPLWAAPLPTLRPTLPAKETQEDLEFWSGACSLYCALGPSVQASSQLREKGRKYPGEQAQDFDLTTAWVEGKPGYGIGEFLEYTYSGKDAPAGSHLAVTEVRLFNGYRKTPEVWKANSRVKRLRLLVNGRPTANLDLKDSMKMQTFKLKPIPLPHNRDVVLRFQIVSVYPGDRYQDTAITDLTFDGTGHH